MVPYSQDLLTAKVRADISNRRFLATLFFTLFCLVGFAHSIAIKKELMLLEESWPFFCLEAVFATASILFFIQMRQWQGFMKQIIGAPLQTQGGMKTMTTGKAIVLFFAALLGIFLIAWMVQGNDFFMYKVFAPAQEQVRHDVFKHSQAYTDGMVQDLQRYMLEYQKASPEHKIALKTVIIRESAKVDEKYLPSDLL